MDASDSAVLVVPEDDNLDGDEGTEATGTEAAMTRRAEAAEDSHRRGSNGQALTPGGMAAVGEAASPSGSQVVAFTRTLRQKLRAHGFRPVSSSSAASAANGGGSGLSRQTSETPSTSSRMVTVVQNIYVYVAGSGSQATIMSRPLRLRKARPTDDAFLNDDNPKYRACCHKCHVTRSAFIIGLVELVFALVNLIDAIRNVAMAGRIIPSLFELTFSVAFVVAVVLMIIGVRTERKSFLMPHLVWSIMFICIGIFIIAFIVVAWFMAGGMLAWTLATAESRVQERLDVIEAKTRVGNASVPNGGDLEFNTGEEEDSGDYFDPDAAPHTDAGQKPPAGRVRREAPQEEEDKKAVKHVLWGIVVLLVGIFLLCVGLEVWFFIIIRACYGYLKDKEDFLRGYTLPDGGFGLVKPLPTVHESEEGL